MIRLFNIFLLVCCLTLATVLDPQFQRIRSTREDASVGVLAALMGDSRRLFAHEFFAKADAYFHSGFYPTIFDAHKPGTEPDLVEESRVKSKGADEHEAEGSFLGAPKDWIDRFGRHFYPTVHTHLSEGGANGKQESGAVREILPWLKLSAEMDPHEIATYLTASYWLRTSLDKPAEAAQFLREGLRANPDSYEILLELGRVYFYSRTNSFVARNIFVLARQKWRRQEDAGKKPEPHDYEEILGELVKTDRAQNNPKEELEDLEELKRVAPAKESLQQQIDEAKAKLEKPKQ
jgi:tetratricopeptide (TPR) repeat protein